MQFSKTNRYLNVLEWRFTKIKAWKCSNINVCKIKIGG